MLRRLFWIAQPDQYVGSGYKFLSTFDPDCFDAVFSFPQPRRVSQADRHSAKRQGHVNMIAGRSWKVRYYYPLLTNYPVDKTRLTSVRWSRHNYSNAILQWLDARTFEPAFKLGRKCCAVALERRIQNVILFVIVDRALDPC